MIDCFGNLNSRQIRDIKIDGFFKFARLFMDSLIRFINWWLTSKDHRLGHITFLNVNFLGDEFPNQSVSLLNLRK